VLRKARAVTRNMDTRKEVEETMTRATTPRATQEPDREKEQLKVELEALKAENRQLRARLKQILTLAQET
jgi:cell shape-determining protein MreC